MRLTPVRPDVSVYVLNMGQPVKIVDLAERMIRLSGLQPGYDIEIVFTGMRPGERLNEILFATEEPTIEIGIAGIMAAKPNEPPMQTLRKWIEALEQAIAQDDRATIRDDPEGCGSGIRVDRGLTMQSQGKIVVASQHYPPDPSTTAAIMAEIACRIAGDHEVIVLSGSSGALPASQTGPGKPRIVAVKNRMTGKGRAGAAWRSPSCCSRRDVPRADQRAEAGDVVLTVTAPFMLPYAVAAAARLKGARSALIMHDLFPDVLVMAES